MAIKKYVILEADKARNLRYTTNSIVRLEECFGKSITKLNFDEMKFSDLRTMVWAGLIHDEPGLTHEQAGEIMDDAESLTVVIEKATEALTMAMGGNAEKNQQPAMTAKQPE